VKLNLKSASRNNSFDGFQDKRSDKKSNCMSSLAKSKASMVGHTTGKETYLGVSIVFLMKGIEIHSK